MREDVKYVHEKIQEAGGLPQIDNAIGLIMEHTSKQHVTANGDIFHSKNIRLSSWTPTKEEIYWLVVSIFTTTLVNKQITYQAIVGKHCDAIPMDNTEDRIQTIAEVIALICHADLIDINAMQGEYHVITPSLVLDNIPVTDKHGTVYHRPQLTESNWDSEQGYLLCGGKLNYHDGDICLDHINRMNNIPLVLNKEFLLKFPEEPKVEFEDSPETSDGNPGMTAQEKQDLWDKYTSDAKHRYAHALITHEKLYLNHKMDTRGRTYAVGYYINTQGTSYKKASLQLANKEYLN